MAEKASYPFPLLPGAILVKTPIFSQYMGPWNKENISRGAWMAQ